MDVSAVFSLPEGLVLERIEPSATELAIAVQSTSPTAECPVCHTPSERLHSRYQRVVADLPCGGRQVILCLGVRRFFCPNVACVRRIFTERLPSLVQPWARRTKRQVSALCAVGFATSGEAGARLAAQLGMPVSPSTLRRQIKAASVGSTDPVTKIGLDDFAFRRGLTYGTIIIDLETHRVVDLLPDRLSATVIAWLQHHPLIELVSRDRGADYAAAARAGAPQAVQVADRWHLIHNLGEYVCLLLERYGAELHALSPILVPPGAPKTAQTGAGPEMPASSAEAPLALPLVTGAPYRSPWIQAIQQVRRGQRLDRYHQVVELHQSGITQAQMAQQVGLSPRTLRRLLALGSFPEQRQRRRRPSLIDPYEAYVLRRWQAGCRNGLQIWQEITAQGYAGSHKAFYSYLNRLRPSGVEPGEGETPARKRRTKSANSPAHPTPHTLARRAVWLWLRPPADLTPAEQVAVLALCQVDPHLKLAYHLAQGFVSMLRHRHAEWLDAWLAEARSSGLAELERFGRGIEQDKAAVSASLSLPYSNGPTEGKVNKLKLIKRQMYGRAGFALLKQRVLYAGE